MNVEVVIEPGAISVSAVDLVIDHENVKIYEIDLHSKYPGDIFYVSTSDSVAVCLFAGLDTLHVAGDDRDKRTVIEFRFPGAHNWGILAEAVRYSCRVALWNRDRSADQGGS